MPQSAAPPRSKRSDVKGIAISSDPAVAYRRVFTNQTASQLAFDLAALVRHLLVGARPLGVGHEDEAVPAIGERVEDDLEAVLVAGR